jgi:nicotinamide-nucleotide amidase
LKAVILTIGDELTCGYRLDTNSQVISQRLSVLPVEIAMHLSVGDDQGSINTGLQVAHHVADIIVVTGGLGPTEDDLTRQTIAAYFGLGLVEDERALNLIKERFVRFGREMPHTSRVQAQAPAGSTIIYNDRGTAAGFYLSMNGKHLFATPGIPYEMEGMLEMFILPRLRELVGHGRHVHRAALKVYGLPEPKINDLIRPMLARDRNPLLGLLPDRGTITIEVVATGGTQEEADALIEADVTVLRDTLGWYVISDDERDLPHVLGDLLVEHGLTIATGELGTNGLVAARLTEPEGYSRWFRSGNLLDACSDTRDEGVELASALAARQATIADIGIGVGPVVVPQDSTPERPYAVAHVAVNMRGQETCRRLSFNGNRARVREWIADAALALVRQQVLELYQQEGLTDQSQDRRRV